MWCFHFMIYKNSALQDIFVKLLTALQEDKGMSECMSTNSGIHHQSLIISSLSKKTKRWKQSSTIQWLAHYIIFTLITSCCQFGVIFVVNFSKGKKNREIAFQHVQFRKSVQEIIRKRSLSQCALDFFDKYYYRSQSYKEILNII